jgi:carbon-monoxide dehydrogenase catalytic subunit
MIARPETGHRHGLRPGRDHETLRIGIQGICCKNCAMGPCRLPLPKGGIEGEDTRKGLCGATANTIAARNFAAWSPPARQPIPTTAAVWRKSSCPPPAKKPMLTRSKTPKLLAIAP